MFKFELAGFADPTALPHRARLGSELTLHEGSRAGCDELQSYMIPIGV
jgi:hypothetical protein